jgi:hypothetical protein
MMTNSLVSCICCTYGRFNLLRRSIACWLSQDYPAKELIIFNTAAVPLTLHQSLEHTGIRVINQPARPDGLPYTSLGAVRSDALEHARGRVYVCWDDDDLFLPWHLSQGMDHLARCRTAAWMPAQSYFSPDGGRTFLRDRNVFEASVLVRIDALLRYGFDSTGKSGAEHLPWRHGLVRDGELREDSEVTPFESYVYVWGDPGHKTSSTIDAPDNFQRHLLHSTDFGAGPLTAEMVERLEWYYVNLYRSVQDERLQARLNQHLLSTRV